MKEKNIQRNLLIAYFIFMLLFVSGVIAFGQTLNPTFQSVKVDSVRARSDTIWLSDTKGGICYLRTKDDTLFFGDATGEKKLGNLSIGGVPGGSPGDIQFNNAGNFGGAPITTDGTDITTTGNISSPSAAFGKNISGMWGGIATLNKGGFNYITPQGDTHSVLDSLGFYLETDFGGTYTIVDAKSDNTIFALGKGNTSTFAKLLKLTGTKLWLEDYVTNDTLFKIDNSGSVHTKHNLYFSDNSFLSFGVTWVPSDAKNYVLYYNHDSLRFCWSLIKDFATDTLQRINADTINAGVINASKINADFIESTQFGGVNLDVNRIERDTTYHAMGGFQDSTRTINIPVVNTWYQVTNQWHNLVSPIAAQGFTLSGDSLKVLHTGAYTGAVSITFSGTNGNEYQFRGYNATKAEQIGYKQGVTATGTGDYKTVVILLYNECNAGDKLVLQVENITAANPAIVRHFQFQEVYLHE